MEVSALRTIVFYLALFRIAKHMVIIKSRPTFHGFHYCFKSLYIFKRYSIFLLSAPGETAHTLMSLAHH